MGYKMFGVELYDFIDELHAYGCDGCQSSFYEMQKIQDDSFDFGIVDRCMFNGKFSQDGPHFEEIFRTIKPNGALIGILYGSWTEDAISELADHGDLTYSLTRSKKHPFLAFCVDRMVSPTKDSCCFDTEFEKLVSLPKENRIMLTKNIYQIYADNYDLHYLLYIPTNEMIVIKSEGKDRCQVSRESYPKTQLWPTAPAND